MPTPTVEAFDIGEVILTSLEALLGAAALHLGETFPDGRALPAGQRDPDDAWKALLAASGIVSNVGPLMDPDFHEAMLARVDQLAERLAADYPDREFPVPEAAVIGL